MYLFVKIIYIELLYNYYDGILFLYLTNKYFKYDYINIYNYFHLY